MKQTSEEQCASAYLREGTLTLVGPLDGGSPLQSTHSSDLGRKEAHRRRSTILASQITRIWTAKTNSINTEEERMFVFLYS